MRTTSPAFTAWPTDATSLITLPGIGALTADSPAAGAAAGAAGAAGADAAGAATGAGAGAAGAFQDRYDHALCHGKSE